MVESKETSTIAKLNQVLIDSRFSPNVAIDNSVQYIDLGTIGKEAEVLERKSLGDAHKYRERGKVIYVTPNRKVLTPHKDVIGKNLKNGGKTGRLKMEGNTFMLLPDGDEQFIFTGSILHTHGDIDLPPSPQDLTFLFYPKSSALLSPSIFVITMGTKYVIFRGQNTPQWDESFISRQLKLWRQQLNEDLGKSRPNFLSDRAVHNNWISQVAMQHDLKVFTCPSVQNIATKR